MIGPTILARYYCLLNNVPLQRYLLVLGGESRRARRRWMARGRRLKGRRRRRRRRCSSSRWWCSRGAAARPEGSPHRMKRRDAASPKWPRRGAALPAAKMAALHTAADTSGRRSFCCFDEIAVFLHGGGFGIIHAIPVDGGREIQRMQS